MKNRISNFLTLLRNKYYADMFRSKRYKNIVKTNPRKAINLRWKAYHGHSLDWDNPKDLDEKIAWLSVMSDTSEWTRLSDKYEVRKYISDLGLGHILTKCYGVWNTVNEIDFEQLPREFVIKCTHDSGSTFIVRDKQKEDFVSLKAKLNSFLYRKEYSTCEPHYHRIQPRVMAEELLKSDVEPIETVSMIDYKIWCFNGVPFCFFVCYDRYRDVNGRIKVTYDLYGVNPWRPIRDRLSQSMQNQNFKDVPEPDNLQEMLDVSSKLSKGFPQVRVDLYNVNGKVYFGEMTFTSSSGSNYFFSDELKLEMGQQIDLSLATHIV